MERPVADRPRRAALVCAVAAAGVALAWQALTVRANFAGDWSAFYYTGAFSRVPPPLAAERVYTIPGSAGYDGQYYHFIAHDPWLRRGFAAYVDNPRMRWRRILVPGLAALLSGFDDDYTDSLYEVVLLASVFLGAYWLSRWGAESGSDRRAVALHPGPAADSVDLPAGRGLFHSKPQNQ